MDVLAFRLSCPHHFSNKNAIAFQYFVFYINLMKLPIEPPGACELERKAPAVSIRARPAPIVYVVLNGTFDPEQAISLATILSSALAN